MEGCQPGPKFLISVERDQLKAERDRLRDIVIKLVDTLESVIDEIDDDDHCFSDYYGIILQAKKELGI